MRRMETTRSRVGASRKVFAGVLPSTFLRSGIENDHLAEQRHLTARAVLSALDQLIGLHHLDAEVPILVLGGRGYIASEVLRLCAGRRVSSVDVGEWDEFARFVADHANRPAVVINLTKSGALSEYAGKLWPGVIILNEVYPEPSASEIVALEEQGAKCYHIVGVAGRAWPPFPKAYRGGIPCCASLPISPDDPIPVLLLSLSRHGDNLLSNIPAVSTETGQE